MAPNRPLGNATRDRQGRFVRGNPGSPGRKPRQVERDYLTATIGAVSIEDWVAIVTRAVAQAKRGNKDARKWLSDLIVVNPDTFADITVGPVVLRMDPDSYPS